MLCYKCKSITFCAFCKNCESVLSKHSLGFKEVGRKKVYYFYPYSEIKDLIHSKHKFYGSFVYNALANLSFKKFSKAFEFGQTINCIPIDDNIKSGYSHSAILASKLKSADLKPMFNVIRARSDVTYSGKSLKYRVLNKRDFKLNKVPQNPVILVDDIITSGETFKQAFDVFELNGVKVLFGLVLANAQQ